MRHSHALLLLTAITSIQTVAAGPPPRRDIDNVVAFARLYGVVRYFYPSDAAAGLDWNRFVVQGVSQVRIAADARKLETALKELFGPLGPGIEIGATLTPAGAAGQSDLELVAWRYFGPGLSGASRPYSAKRTHRAQINPGIDGFVTLMQTAPAAALRGKTIRLRGQVRARASDEPGSAALWLRVDRESRSPGFFDNMGNRPIRDAAWHQYEIEGTVADDAANVAFGVMASGQVTADFDAIELAVRDSASGWVPIPIRDAGFEAGPAAASPEWSRAGTSGNAVIARPVDGAPEGKQFVRFSAPTVPAVQAELFEEGAPTSGAHVDLDLGSGLKARIPLALSDSQARAATKSANADATPGPDSASLAISTRMADVVVAWNVFRHFYPYWSETGVDWDARLRPRLEDAYLAGTRDAEGNVLRYLVADARDGHGGVIDMRRTDAPGMMPVRLRAIGNRIVVTASSSPSEAPVGAVVSAINGTPAGQRLAAAMRLASGTTQWKEARALQEIAACPAGNTVTLMVDSGRGPRQSKVPCATSRPPMEKRPEPVTEVAPAVWYVDLTRPSMADVTAAMEKLATAAGVIFDVRGYPTDAGVQVLRHLLPVPETDRWMHVAKITGPSGQIAGWQSFGWDLTPLSPRFSGKIVFMTDGRAISYAESVMGYVADRKLGTIIGSTTAGTNGNVVRFELPGAFAIFFTGMRVTRHDGRSPYHLAGTSPDIPAVPTIEGLRAGRDEVLERAIAFIRAR